MVAMMILSFIAFVLGVVGLAALVLVGPRDGRDDF